MLGRFGARLATAAGAGNGLPPGRRRILRRDRGIGPSSVDEILAATIEALSDHGEGWQIDCAYGTVDLPTEARDVEGALRLADQRLYAAKQSGRRSSSRQSTDVLLQALLERDPDLGTHLHDVGDLTATVGAQFGLATEDLDVLRLAGELHDIGKVAIPDAIMSKPGPLDPDEWAIVRQHTIIGERILAAAPALSQVAKLVRSSHERYDGTGYPEGMAGSEIPLGSRIVAVCDAFDAMIGPRPYRRGMTEEAAIAELRGCAGTQFDPKVVEAFCALRTEDGAASGLQLIATAL